MNRFEILRLLRDYAPDDGGGAQVASGSGAAPVAPGASPAAAPPPAAPAPAAPPAQVSNAFDSAAERWAQISAAPEPGQAPAQAPPAAPAPEVPPPAAPEAPPATPQTPPVEAPPATPPPEAPPPAEAPQIPPEIAAALAEAGPVSPEMVKAALARHMQILQPFQANAPGADDRVTTFYNEIYERNPSLLGALVDKVISTNITHPEAYAPLVDRVLGEMFGGASRADIEAALAGDTGQQAGFGDFSEFGATAEPSDDPRDQRIQQLEREMTQFKQGQQRQRTEAQQQAHAQEAERLNGYFGQTVDAPVAPIMEAINWGPEFDSLKALAVSAAKTDAWADPQLRPLLSAAQHFISGEPNEASLREVAPVIAKALRDKVAANVNAINRLVASHNELQTMKQQQLQGQVRIAGAPAGAPGDSAAQQPAANPVYSQDGNVFDQMSQVWRNMPN